MTPALEVRGLEVPFGDGPGLAGISLQVAAGERLALVGPSGSGKTSLLRALAGSGRTTAGSVWIAGTEVTRFPAERRQSVLLSQRPLLFPHLSVFENVAFPLRVRGVRQPELARRVHEALEAVHLTDLRDRAPSALSGGQAHRVALARAVVARPPVLLLDEPLNSLDPALREEVGRAILDVQAEYGPAMILVTHELAEAGRSSDRVAVLLDGDLCQVAPPEELFRRPATIAVARFLGLPNELPAALDGTGRLTLAGWLLRGATRCADTLDGTSAPRAVTVVFGTDGAKVTPAGEGDLPCRVVGVLHHPHGATVRVEVRPGPSPGPARPGSAFICEVAADPEYVPQAGQKVSLAVNPRRLQLFAADPSGRRL